MPPLVRRKEAQGKSARQRLTTVASRLKSLFFELEFVLRGQRLAAPVHQAKQRLIEGGGALVVGIGKGGAGHRLDPQVIEALDADFLAGDAVPQADSGRELQGEEVHQLAPTGKDRAFRPVPCSVSNLPK
jgi:hypothetical protein